MVWNGDGGQKPRSPWGGSPQQTPIPTDLDAMLRSGQKQFKRLVGGDRTPPKIGKKSLWLAGLVALALWFSSGFYILQEEEQAVVLRFGKYVRTAGPGPNYRLPSPIETTLKEKVTRVERMEIGFRSSGGRSTGAGAGASTRTTLRNVPEESLMLTGDENIANINFEVQWRIKSLEHYIFKVEAPIETLKSGSESVMRELVGQSNIGEIQTTGRSVIETRATSLLQQMMDSYQTGVEVVSVNLLPIDPPEPVVDAFRKVQSAEAEKQTTINNATKQRNQILPVARGEAARMLQEAEAYKSQKVAEAEGQASRFDAVYQAYSLSKDVTKKRLYLEMLETVLPGINKYIMDSDLSHNLLPHLALPALKAASAAVPVSPAAAHP